MKLNNSNRVKPFYTILEGEESVPVKVYALTGSDANEILSINYRESTWKHPCEWISLIRPEKDEIGIAKSNGSIVVHHYMTANGAAALIKDDIDVADILSQQLLCVKKSLELKFAVLANHIERTVELEEGMNLINVNGHDFTVWFDPEVGVSEVELIEVKNFESYEK